MRAFLILALDLAGGASLKEGKYRFADPSSRRWVFQRLFDPNWNCFESFNKVSSNDRRFAGLCSLSQARVVQSVGVEKLLEIGRLTFPIFQNSAKLIERRLPRLLAQKPTHQFSDQFSQTHNITLPSEGTTDRIFSHDHPSKALSKYQRNDSQQAYVYPTGCSQSFQQECPLLKKE